MFIMLSHDFVVLEWKWVPPKPITIEIENIICKGHSNILFAMTSHSSHNNAMTRKAWRFKREASLTQHMLLCSFTGHVNKWESHKEVQYLWQEEGQIKINTITFWPWYCWNLSMKSTNHCESNKRFVGMNNTDVYNRRHENGGGP